MKTWKKGFAALACCLLLPAAALAVTEGVVEAAPSVEMESVVGGQAAMVSYLPDESYYAGYGDWYPAWENAQEWVESRFDGECYHDVEQRPRMTAGEAARAMKLLEDYGILELVRTGVVALERGDDVMTSDIFD